MLVTLTCGHRIGAMNEPWRSGQKYSCTLGQGCGYSLGWTSWHDKENPGLNGVNDALARK